jgi:hypothetical protein
MKKKYLFTAIVIASAIMLYSCSDNPGLDHPGQYMKIYMPRAVNSPSPNSILLTDTTYTFAYSAYLGGPGAAKHNVHISFGVVPAAVDSFNAANGTNYVLMPNGSYTLGTKDAVIHAGQRSTDSLTLSVDAGKSKLKMVNTYLLPLGITKVEGTTGTISKTLGITYFIFKARPRLAPRTKVLSLGQDWGDILANGPDGVLYKRDPGKVIHVYVPDKNGVYSNPPTKFPGGPWNASGWFYYINNNTEFVVNNDGYYGGFRFDVDPNTYLLSPSPTVNASDPFPTNFGFYYGDGWNVYNVLAAGDYVFLVNKNNGDLLQVSMSDFLNKAPGTWHKITDIQNANNVIASGFDAYKQVLALDASGSYYLLAVKSDGTLWAYPISKNGDVGDAKQIGSGWNKYVKLITTGDDILALDSNGDLYRYKNIDPNVFYRVKS